MNSDQLQRLRYKLQKRVRRVNGTDYHTFQIYLTHLFQFFHANPIINGVLSHLSHNFSNLKAETEQRFDNGSPFISGEDENEHAALSYYTLMRWVNDPECKWIVESLKFSDEVNHDDRLRFLLTLFLEPLYEYLDESLDEVRAVLGLLVRYKHRCEWYKRKELYRIYENDTTRGEHELADDMYLYLHDAGLDFIVEARSASGIPDFLVQETELEKLVAEVKVLREANQTGITYLTKGFNQVYTYLNDCNEQFGYLVIFNVSGKPLSIDVSGANSVAPYVTHNGKTIFLIVIDISLYETSASKRGPLKSIVLTEDELVTQLSSSPDDSEEGGEE